MACMRSSGPRIASILRRRPPVTAMSTQPHRAVRCTRHKRWLGASSMQEQWPSGTTYSLRIVQPSGNTQYYNTVGPVNTAYTGPSWTPGSGNLGTYVIKDSTNVGPTICHFTPTIYPATPIEVNVLKCKPEFDEPSTYPDLITRLAPGNITIYLPSSLSGLSTPLTNAVDAWKDLIPDTGVIPTVTNTDCGSGATCVRVEEADLGNDPAGNPICAQKSGNYDTATGYYSSQIKIRIDDSWTAAGAARLERTFAHELGHLLGLDESLCGGPDSVMRGGVYSCTDTSTSVPNDPTMNDSLPVNKTSYGGGPKTSCGF
jgi:hypothetical protein